MIKRCSRCGCYTFKAYKLIEKDIIVDGEGNIKKEEKTIESIQEPYICKKCGNKYETLERLWKDRSPYVGIIHYLDSGEKYKCKTDEELLKIYENDLNCRGPLLQEVIEINPKNISLQYDVLKLLKDQYGEKIESFKTFLSAKKPY